MTQGPASSTGTRWRKVVWAAFGVAIFVLVAAMHLTGLVGPGLH